MAPMSTTEIIAYILVPVVYFILMLLIGGISDNFKIHMKHAVKLMISILIFSILIGNDFLLSINGMFLIHVIIVIYTVELLYKKFRSRV